MTPSERRGERTHAWVCLTLQGSASLLLGAASLRHRHLPGAWYLPVTPGSRGCLESDINSAGSWAPNGQNRKQKGALVLSLISLFSFSPSPTCWSH